MDNQIQTPVPLESPTPPRSVLARLTGMFHEPGAVLEDVARRPSWVWPVVVMMIVTLATALIVTPRIDMAGTIREQMESSGRQISEAQLEQAVEIGSKFARVQAYVSPIFVPLLLLVLSGLYLLGLRMAGSVAPFQSVFSGVAHALLPSSVVGGVLMAIVAWPREGLTGTEVQHLVRSSVGAWLGPDTHKALVGAAGVLDLFNLWQWILTVFALQIIGKVRRGSAIAIVAGVWGAWLLIKAGFGFLQ